MKLLKASLIISTYNQPDWLEKVLWSCEFQTEKDFEIIIADDGSTIDTKQFIETFKKSSKLNIKHVWHEDNGFQKTIILNKAITKSNTDYLIFTDGDCVLRNDFIAMHLKLREKNYALSGGYFKLTKAISYAINKEHISTQECFNKEWLLSKGQPRNFKMNKLTHSKFKVWLLNTFTTTKATFDGMNVSTWKEDILNVNGFDERMQYGGEDREIGERLMNNGIKFKQIRYSAICLHLYHSRPYKNNESLLINKNIRKQTRKSKSVYTNYGIIKPRINAS